MRQNLILISILFFTACQSNEPLQLNGRTMGTTYNITLILSNQSPNEKEHLQTNIDSLLETVNQQMSTYIKDSEISLFNRMQSTTPFRVSAPFVNVLQLALKMHQESNGAFDATVGPLVNLWGFGPNGPRDSPPAADEIKLVMDRIGSQKLEVINDTTIRKLNSQIQLDFGAIAKGYGVDAVAELLSKKGYINYLVEIGGEVVVSGTKNGALWRVGVDRPQPGAQPGADLQTIVELSNQAMATSGDYRNYFSVGDSSYSHEIDPRTGQSIITGVASVTVLAPSCMLADAMATAIMVMGAEDGLKWVESKPEVEALIILHDEHNFKEVRSTNFH